jgi:hypothetical protein
MGVDSGENRLHGETLRGWVRQAARDAGVRPGARTRLFLSTVTFWHNGARQTVAPGDLAPHRELP